MDFMHAVVLGVAQGLTEFLPISSSGHLVLIPWLFGWRDLGPIFDVALHLGTLAALAAFFWREWRDMLTNWRDPFLWLIIAGCVPAAVVGFKYEEYFDTFFRGPVFVGSFMIVMGVVMGAAELYGKKIRGEDTINLRDSLIIGCAQALALMPGVSRSGITMTAGMFSGLKRESAARFSFLLAMPITAGAGLLKFTHLMKSGIPSDEVLLFVTGIICASVVGYFAIKYLLKFLQTHSLYIFVWYRIAFGSMILLVNSMR
jgi:undecaprenyl-diphosphatase